MNPPHNPEIENLIHMEIVVDAYDSQERAMGWYYYLQNNLAFPFAATCRRKKHTNHIPIEQTCTVVSMAEVDECDDDIYVMVIEGGDELAVSLEHLSPAENSDPKTLLAAEGWHYWKDRGYHF